VTPEQKLKADRIYKKRMEEYELEKQLQAILEKKAKNSKPPIDSARRGTLAYNAWQRGIRGDGQVFRGHCGR
jgi:hypothetical protein